MTTKNLGRRMKQADTITADALSAFEKAAEDLELASRLYEDVEADINSKISDLSTQAAAAKAAGEKAKRSAHKLRNLFS